MMEDIQRLTNYYIAKANDELRTRLAQADQQIEWLSKENTSLRRHAKEVTTELLELRSVTSEALDTIRKRVAHDAAEIEKWKGLSDDLGLDLLEARYTERTLRDRVALLEKVLNSKPGTMHFGGSLFINGQPIPPREIIDAVWSLRMEHFHNDEDRWFSCPKSGECANDAMPTDMCTCGADAQNATVDRILAYLMMGSE